MNERNRTDKEMPLSNTFPNSDVKETKFLSENEIKKEENESDREFVSIKNDEIKEEIMEVNIKEEYASDIYEDVLQHSNQFPDTADDLKSENETNSDFDALSTYVDEIKIEIEEANMKKECFGNVYENICGYSNQLPDMRVREEFEFVAVGHTPELDQVSRESFSIVATEEKIIGSNELNVSVNRDTKSVKEQQIDGTTSINKYECDLCKKRFTNESHLKLHDCVHEKLNSDRSEANLLAKMKPFTCDVCNKSYVKEEQLFLHKRIHTDEKPYICPICKKVYVHKLSLVDHERLHTDEKSYNCEICKKSFTEKANLVRHVRIHTAEKPYSCQVCQKSYLIRSHLVIHERTHTGEKPYSCQICEKSFTVKSALVKHERVHAGDKPFSCKVCRKSFLINSHLVIHERTHTGEKLYSCETCKKSFARKTTLVQHKICHTGEKPYTCEICKKAFLYKSSVIQHTKRYHT